MEMKISQLCDNDQTIVLEMIAIGIQKAPIIVAACMCVCFTIVTQEGTIYKPSLPVSHC